MKNDHTTYSDDKLLKAKFAVMASARMWLNSKDGSYELALHNMGYDEILEEIKKRGLAE